MTDLERKIIACAISEVETPQLAATEQFFEVHKIARQNNTPVVARVDLEKKDGTAIVYFHVQDEAFYFAVYVDIEPEITLRWVNTVAAYSVYFSVVSEIFDAATISAKTTLMPTKSWSRGDNRNGRIMTFTKVIFEPNPEADEFEEKIEKLLDYLLSDKENIISLVRNYEGYIQVAAIYHNGNTMLGGAHLTTDVIKKLAELELPIDFDLCAEGNLFKEEDESWYEE